MTNKLIYIILFALSKIPLNTLYSLSTIIYYINHYLINYRLITVKRNLKMCFPNYNQDTHKKIINNFYRFLFDVIIEVIKSIKLKEYDIKKRVTISNISVIEESVKKEKPIILISSHYANWEWLLLRLSIIENITLKAVYKPLSNKYLEQILFNIRSKFGAILIRMEKWKYFIIKNSSKPYTYLFLSDQVPNHINNGEKIIFLNKKTLFYQGAEKIQSKLQGDVIYVEMLKLKKGYYNIEFKKINSTNITEEYVKLLEKTIYKQPENWLWSHKRWKR